MYSVGVFANISELTTFPFANIKKIAEKSFLQKENFRFALYTKEQKEVFIAGVQTGLFDGIVFATNTTNDTTLKTYFEDNKSIFSDFLASGGGILILLQYHLAIANLSFDILSSDDFPGIINCPIVTRQNNDEKNTPISYDPQKLVCKENSYIFSYPRNVLVAPTRYFYSAMENNKWQTGKSPLFACICNYPESDFYSIIDYRNTEEDITRNSESFCIVSRNVRKRVVMTTLALDLEENFLLENLITYVAKGEPDVFFKTCGKCRIKGTCDFDDLLNNTKIHYTDNEGLKSVTKYEIVNCSKMIAQNCTEMNDIANRIPIKQLAPINNGGQISRTINVSAIRYTCNLGAQYLRTKLSNGKYGSLIGTLSTLRLFKMMGIDVLGDDRESIIKYLKSHNKDKRSFDSVKASTSIAREIIDILDYVASDVNFEVIDDIPKEIRTVKVSECNEIEISALVKLLGQDFTPIETLIVHNNLYELKEVLLIIFARILSSKDSGRISWENDCFMTSLMLIVLLKIEAFLAIYDEKNKTNCVVKVNVIASYFEETSEMSLYNALVSAADSERERAHMLLEKLAVEKESANRLLDENDKLKSEKQEFEVLENNILQEKTVIIILIFIIISIIFLFIIVALRSHYSDDNIYEFLISLSPLEIVLSIAGLIIVPYTIGTLYMKKSANIEKKKNKN